MFEEFLHFIWKHKLYAQQSLLTHQGQSVEVIHPGDINSNAGPDFFNAKIKIDGTLWAGNVEVHVKASNWLDHQHQNDKAYDNVILHVVEEVDSDTFTTQGQVIPILKLPYSSLVFQEYLDLKNNKDWLSCGSKLNLVNPFEFNMWLDRMLVERLEYKMQDIIRILEQTNNNWDETFYRLLFRSFGFGVNGVPFELLAQSIPLKILLKYADNIQLIEALLLGQSGFLNQDLKGDYAQKLLSDYLFLKQKHQLEAVHNYLWKFLRLRPGNFPTIRIAQLSALLVKLKGVFGKILNENDLNILEDKLDASVSVYWKTHYTFKKESKSSEKCLGRRSKQLLIINTIVPYLFAFGKQNGQEAYAEKAIEWLRKIKAEQNNLLNKWKEYEIVAKNAADSQALIYLSNYYCKQQKCLHCRIGHNVLAINN